MPDQFEVEADWVHISHDESTVMREVYGYAGRQGSVNLEGVRFRARGCPSKTLLMYMHPATTLQLLPVPRAMASAGAHVLCAGSRYARNDAPLIMEKVLIDYGAYIRHAKEVWEYDKVVLMGWSGGGSLTVYYQSQAERASVTQTPAGDPVDLVGLTPGDAVVFQAAHLSRADVLCDFIDPAILDENDPTKREIELDLYDARNPNRPPYTAEYLTQFRAAQFARMQRRTAWVKDRLADLRRSGSALEELGMLTHCTLAEPRFLDATIDPNDRAIGHCFMGEPRAANFSPAGIARYSSLRAWLSQWSIEDSQANALRNIRNVTAPLLVIENSADDAVPQPHSRMVYDAAASSDSSFECIMGANHYYAGQPELLDKAVDLTVGWMRARRLIE